MSFYSIAAVRKAWSRILIVILSPGCRPHYWDHIDRKNFYSVPSVTIKKSPVPCHAMLYAPFNSSIGILLFLLFYFTLSLSLLLSFPRLLLSLKWVLHVWKDPVWFLTCSTSPFLRHLLLLLLLLPASHPFIMRSSFCLFLFSLSPPLFLPNSSLNFSRKIPPWTRASFSCTYLGDRETRYSNMVIWLKDVSLLCCLFRLVYRFGNSWNPCVHEEKGGFKGGQCMRVACLWFGFLVRDSGLDIVI